MASFIVSPSIIRLSDQTHPVPIQLIGSGTSWSSAQPAFSLAVVEGATTATIDTIAWTSDVLATANINTSQYGGRVQITDPSTGATFNLLITATKPFPGRLRRRRP